MPTVIHPFVIPVIVLFAVFLLIALRHFSKAGIQIWHIMLFGALAVLLTLQISPIDAFLSINADVMLFLFGMFVVGEALEQSGYISHLSHKLFKRARSMDHLVLLVLFGIGTASAFLMNDTLAIMGTPVVLALARRNSASPKLLLLALAYAITIGSAVSPIGNPQNLLIAVNGRVADPFATFFRYLFVPTVINLLLAYVMLRLFFRREFGKKFVEHAEEPIRDPRLAVLSKAALVLVIILVAAKISVVLVGLDVDFRLTYIALIPALLILLLSPRRAGILKGVDWRTLVFFASMFVLMQSVWNTGFFQGILGGLGADVGSVLMILLVSVVLSQFISNVPLAALFLPMLLNAGASPVALVALAAGSTIAGNLFILGAASNVIIIQNAERRGETLTFAEFAKVGIPLTALNVLVYLLLIPLF